jgi:hypothetical protein
VCELLKEAKSKKIVGAEGGGRPGPPTHRQEPLTGLTTSCHIKGFDIDVDQVTSRPTGIFHRESGALSSVSDLTGPTFATDEGNTSMSVL